MRLGRLAFALGCVLSTSAKQTIWITSIQPFTGGVWDGGIAVSAGADLMLEQVNAHSNLLRDYELKMIHQDGQCSGVEGARIFHLNVFQKRYFPFAPNYSRNLGDLDLDGDGSISKEEANQLSPEWGPAEVSPEPIGVMGPGCSDGVLNVMQIAYYMRLPLIANMASRPALSDRTLYPNFFRLIIPDTFFASAWITMARMLGMTSMLTVIAETQYWGSMGERMVLEADTHGVTLVGADLSHEIPGFHGVQVTEQSVLAAKEAATLLMRYRQRIIVMLMFSSVPRLIMCEAYKLGMRNAVFMVFGWMIAEWWTVPDTSCTAEQLTIMARGFISAQMSYWRYDVDAKLSCSENMTAGEFREEWFRRLGAPFGDYSRRPEGFEVVPESSITADAVCMWALALDTFLVDRGIPLTDLVARKENAYNTLIDLFQVTDFQGVQGRVSFAPGSGDPFGYILLEQLHVDESGTGTVVEIATSNKGTLNFLGKADLIFGLPGERVFAGPAGASTISLGLTPYATCGRDQTLDMEHNRCMGCPPGTIYLDVVKDCVCRAGYALVNGTCSACGPGTFAPTDGMAQCTSCPAGSFSQDNISKSCSRCPVGRFSEDPGSSECTSCESEFGKGMTTYTPGTTARAECRCGGKTYQDAESRACFTCPDGMECPFGSDTAIGASVQPLLLPMYWSHPDEPLSVYRCENSLRCPGGNNIGTCGPHTKARACAHCEEGFIWDGMECVECSAIARSGFLFPVLPLMLIPIIVCGLYSLGGDDYAKWGSWQNGLAAMVFILLNWAQILALMQSVELDLPEDALRLFENLAFANDLVKAFAPHCAGFSSFHALQAIGLIAPAIVLVLAFLSWLVAWGLSRFTNVGWLKMETDRTWNVAMSLIYTFFTSIVTISCTLFKCGPNPNGTQSLVADRSIVCFEGEWFNLLAVEIVGILIWCCGVACLFSRAIFYSSARYFHREGVRFRWKFLFLKYRPDVHWWSLVFMARAVILNLGIISVQQSASKLYWIISVIMLYFALLSVFRPWRHRINNLIDGLTQFSLIAVGSFLTHFAIVTQNLDYAMSQVTLGAFLLCIFLSAVLCCSMVFNHIRTERIRSVSKEGLDAIISAFRTAERAKEEDFMKFLENLGEWDALHMRTAKNIIMTEFCKVISRAGLSQHKLSRRIVPEHQKSRTTLQSTWRGTVDWNVVDSNVGRFSVCSDKSTDELPNKVVQALELIHGVSRVA